MEAEEKAGESATRDTPLPETETSLSRGIGLANQMYRQHFNRKFKQSGRIGHSGILKAQLELQNEPEKKQEKQGTKNYEILR